MIQRIVIAVPLILMPFLFGAVQPWHQAIVFSSFLVLLICCLWTSPSIILPLKTSKNPINSSNSTNPKNPINPSNPTNPITLTLIAFILIYPFLQAIPLPLSWLEFLSPERYFWLDKAREVTGLEPAWSSLSYTPVKTVFTGLRWLLVALIGFIVYRFLNQERQFHWFIKLLFFIALAEALYGLMQALIPSLHVLWSDQQASMGNARGTFINRNHFACFLNLIWPVLLAYLFSLSETFPGSGKKGSYYDPDQKEQLRHKQIFFGFLLGIIVLALFFSRSRGGISCSIIAMTVFVLLLPGKRTKLLFFVAGCWGVMFVYGWIIGFEEILQRFDQITEGASGRYMKWQDSLSMIKDHAVFGIGLEGFIQVFQVYQTHLPESKWICHAHSDYLELVAELGVPVAVLMFVLGWGYWLWQARRVYRQSKSSPGEILPEAGIPSGSFHGVKIKGLEGLESKKKDKKKSKEAKEIQDPHLILAAGALAGTAAFFAHGLVEFNWQIPANQLYFVVMLILVKRFVDLHSRITL